MHLTADNVMLLLGGGSCMLISIAMMIDNKQHCKLPRRQWAGYELLTTIWFMIGVVSIAKGLDQEIALYLEQERILDFFMGVLLMAASIGVGMWSIRGRPKTANGIGSGAGV